MTLTFEHPQPPPKPSWWRRMLRRVTPTEMHIIEGHLAWRYGIQAALPRWHPHKHAPPEDTQ